MAAVLVDELSGNSLLHDLLHLQGTWGGRGEADWMGCCTPGLAILPPECLQAVWGVWVNPSSFHSLLAWGRSVPISLSLRGGLSRHLFQRSCKMYLSCTQLPELFPSLAHQRACEELSMGPALSSDSCGVLPASPLQNTSPPALPYPQRILCAW